MVLTQDGSTNGPGKLYVDRIRRPLVLGSLSDRLGQTVTSSLGPVEDFSKKQMWLSALGGIRASLVGAFSDYEFSDFLTVAGDFIFYQASVSCSKQDEAALELLPYAGFILLQLLNV